MEKGSWREAFFSVLPPRKGAVDLAAGGEQAAQDSDSDPSELQATANSTTTGTGTGTTVPPGGDHVEASHASKEEEKDEETKP